MMIFNIQKCILHYYTSVKVGSYSKETICTGSYSKETLFFVACKFRVPILSKHPVFAQRLIAVYRIEGFPFRVSSVIVLVMIFFFEVCD